MTSYPLNNKDEEQAWLRAASCSPVFAFLAEPEEEIYTLAGGQPFRDQCLEQEPSPGRARP